MTIDLETQYTLVLSFAALVDDGFHKLLPDEDKKTLDCHTPLRRVFHAHDRIQTYPVVRIRPDYTKRTASTTLKRLEICHTLT